MVNLFLTTHTLSTIYMQLDGESNYIQNQNRKKRLSNTFYLFLSFPERKGIRGMPEYGSLNISNMTSLTTPTPAHVHAHSHPATLASRTRHEPLPAVTLSRDHFHRQMAAMTSPSNVTMGIHQGNTFLNDFSESHHRQ